MKFNSKVLTVWAKWFGGMILGAITAVAKLKGYNSPFEFHKTDWIAVGNTIWVSLFPVLFKYFNPKDELTFLIKK